MYWPDDFLYLVSFNYCNLCGHSDRGSWPLSGVSVNYELSDGTRICRLWTRFISLVLQVCAVANQLVKLAIALLDCWRAKREHFVMYVECRHFLNASAENCYTLCCLCSDWCIENCPEAHQNDGDWAPKWCWVEFYAVVRLFLNFLVS